MKDITLWIGWYGLLLGIPLIIFSLGLMEWIIGLAQQRVTSEQYRPQR
ncbi:MAG: hypothetical protein H8K05_01390 [Nitrospira sp.]|nr:hypothetical protein [Nitrospira sp.]MCS6316441.1 hypothetical protein [Nitrospira sp.]